MDKTAKQVLIWGGVLVALYWATRPGPEQVQPPGTVGATDGNLDTGIESGIGAGILSGQVGF